MPILSVAQAARLAQVDRAMIRRKISAGILSVRARSGGGKGIELSELLRAYPDAAAQASLMSAQGSPMAALERENERLRQELAAAKEREKWLQNQIDRIQQRLLPSLCQGIIERIAEAVARLRRTKGSA